MNLCDLWIYGYSDRRDYNIFFLKEFVDICSVLDKSEMFVVWTPSGEKQIRQILYSRATDAQLSEIMSRGGIGLSSKSDNLEIGFQFNKESDMASFSLSIPKGLLCDERSTESFIETFIKLVELFNAKYAICFNPSFHDGSYLEYSEVMQGFKDVYWMQYICSDLCQAFNFNNLSQLDIYSVKYTNEGGLYLRTTKDLQESYDQKIKTNFMNTIGLKNFKISPKKINNNNAGVISLTTFIKLSLKHLFNKLRSKL